MFANAPNHNAIEPPDSTPPLSGKYRKSYITKTDALNFLLRALIPGAHNRKLDEKLNLGPRGGFLGFKHASDTVRVTSAAAFAARRGGINHGKCFAVSISKQKLHGPFIRPRDERNHDLFNTRSYIFDPEDQQSKQIFELVGAVILPNMPGVMAAIDFVKDDDTFKNVCRLMKANVSAIEVLQTVRAILRIQV